MNFFLPNAGCEEAWIPLRILMVGTLTGAQWGIYDSFKFLWGCKFFAQFASWF